MMTENETMAKAVFALASAVSQLAAAINDQQMAISPTGQQREDADELLAWSIQCASARMMDGSTPFADGKIPLTVISEIGPAFCVRSKERLDAAIDVLRDEGKAQRAWIGDKLGCMLDIDQNILRAAQSQNSREDR